MNYLITNCKLTICKLVTVILVTLLSSSIFAQHATFVDGVQRGVVKVKFEQSMTATLSKMQIRSSGKTLSTGITAFDKAVSSIKAKHMERIIPVHSNPEIEARHVKAGLHLWYLVEFDEEISPVVAVQQLKAVPGVKIVEREYRKEIIPSTITPYSSTPSTYSTLPFNDPYLKDQWHYMNTGQLNIPGGNADANLDEAWKVVAGRPDVIVAVFDEGVDVNHEDLRGNMWVNTKEIPGNGIDDDGNGYIDDINGFDFAALSGTIAAESHGTHVAGTVAAVNNNGIGVSGVAGGTGANDGAKIMSLRILGGATGGQIFKAYVYAADQGAVISQNSWGYSSPGVFEQDVLDGIDYFIDYAGSDPESPMKGGIVIFAAGNSTSDDMWWPGIYERCFTIAAIGPEWKAASYSNYGKWIEISAPGGDGTIYGNKAAVLSTLPGNQYGYMNGTSMACPHVSGIAALALANSKTQMTNTQLWNLLLTSVIDIDQYNDPMYVGKLGKGTIDAALAVQVNGKQAPEQITTLGVKGIAQEFATLEWKVPSDPDDTTPYNFTLYYSTESITADNISKAKKISVENKKAVGETVECEVSGLLGTTTYYFAIESSDRWGNTSPLSEVISATTNSGPAIDVNTGEADKSVKLSTDITSSMTATKSFQLINGAEGILRWDSYIRNAGHTLSTTAYSASYPTISGSPMGVATVNAEAEVKAVRNTDITTFAAYQTIEKKYAGYVQVYIGDTDTSLPTSGAVKFFVTEENGFNLTQVNVSFSYTLNTGPAIIEIYNGKGLTADNLIFTQEYTPKNTWNKSHTVALDEHIYFEKGETFFIVVHIPGGNTYPLGIGVETAPEYSDYCFYSNDYGQNWALLSTVGVSQTYAWNISAVSKYANIDKYLELKPASGDLKGNSEATIAVEADASTLINGTYKASLVITSNDSKNPNFRTPIEFTVTGHKAQVVYPKIVEFGSTFLGSETVLDIVLENKGYGLTNKLTATVDNPLFEVVSTPSKVDGRDEAKLRVKFKPTTAGNVNGKLNVVDGQNTYTISLFGVGAETSEIVMTPASGIIDNIAIGDVVEANFTLKNNGAYPLAYFIPGFDTKEISKDWPTDYHHYGYATRSNRDYWSADASLVYEFNDISETGVDITSNYIQNLFKEVEFGFDFPFYGTIQKSIFITKSGYTTFDNSSNPYNQPQLGEGDLRGYISLFGLGSGIDLSKGKILYKAESDRFIIQYSNIEVASQKLKGQIVLYATGDIRFYYEDMPQSGSEANMITVLIEDVEKTDGILIRDNSNSFVIENKTVLGFDYPGPNIITNIENGSGIVAPNTSVDVKVTMNTASLSEGVTNRNVNVISNDPDSPITNYRATLNVVSGGVRDYKVSADTIDFGVVYQKYPYKREFVIQNTGSKQLVVSSFDYDNTQFTVEGEMTINPGLNEIYTVTANTENLADLDQNLVINFDGGAKHEVKLLASVRIEPIIEANVDLVSASLEIDGSEKFPYTMKNLGGSDLEVSMVGGQWFRFEKNSPSDVEIVDYDYTFKKENNGEPSYNWIDILETGTKFPYDGSQQTNKDQFWNKFEMPFEFEFYGVKYDSIRVGNNCVIALGGDPESMFWPGKFPFEDNTGASFICPLTSQGSFDTYSYPEDAGLYYQVFEDKVVFSWMYFMNLFGWGQSTQAILYKDGTIKFMYKLTPGVSPGTGTGVVGIQNADGKYTIVSDKTALDLGKGLAFMVMPDNTYSLAPNQTIEGDIILDAQNIYGGNFTDEFIIKSNAPVSSKLTKPVSVSVSGEATAEIVNEVVFDDMEVVFDNNTLEYESVVKTLVLKNTGKAPFAVTNAKMQTGGQNLTMLVTVSSWLGTALVPIEELEKLPEMLILPGATQDIFVRFEPKAAGQYNDVLVLTTDKLGDINISMQGLGYEPAEINIDDTPIVVTFNTLDQTEKRTVNFDNLTGGYKVDYNIYVDYKREAESEDNVTRQTSTTAVPQVDSLTIASKMQSAVVEPSTTTYADFNRKIQYIDEYGGNNSMGNNGTTLTLAATRFTADATGFNLSDVGTWVNLDKDVSGTIKIEVKAGGSSIEDAILVATKMVDFTFPEGVTDKQILAKLAVTLDNSVQILPNEDFYVIFTYPFDLTYPQFIQLGGVEEAANRYLWFQGGEWYDLQAYLASGGFSAGSGVIMYAAEREFKESGWVKILTPSQGTLQVGEKSFADLNIVGTFADRGDQNADLVIKTTDKKSSIVRVPISLHMNEAPGFGEISSTITTSEKEVTTIDFVVTDKENNKFDFVVVEKPEFATIAENADNQKVITLSPEYGDAGSYKLVMKATDEYQAVNEHTIDIHVAKTNQAPAFTGEDTWSYNLGSALLRYNINDLFNDADGDELSFTVSTLDKSVADAYSSNSEIFVVEPRNVGTTKFVFEVTDNNGGVTTQTINVQVVDCENSDTYIVQKWNSSLVVRNIENKFTSYQWYKNGIAIEGATKQYFSTGVGELDFDAQYYVEMTTADGNKVFTCPMQPVKKEIALTVYPNPVAQGEAVNVVAQFPNLENDPATIQIINISGNTVSSVTTKEVENSVPMNYPAGTYIIKVSNANVSKTFRACLNFIELL